MEAKALRKKTATELNQMINDLKAELFTLRFQNAGGSLKQPHKIKAIKRDIAKIYTVIGEQKNDATVQKTITKESKETITTTKPSKKTEES